MSFRGEHQSAFEFVSTLADVLPFWAKRRPDDPAYRFVRSADYGTMDTVTFRNLDRRARLVAGLLHETVGAGARVALLHEPGIEFIAALFGCFHAGIVAVPLFPPAIGKRQDRLINILMDAKPAAVLCSQARRASVANLLAEHGLGQIVCLATDPDGPVPALRPGRAGAAAQSAPVIIQYTSGSTSTPRGVMVGNDNLFHQARAISERLDFRPGDNCLFWLPPYHDMGLVAGILQPMFWGSCSTLLSPLAFLLNPMVWLDGMSRYRITISGAPNFAYDYCVDKIPPAQRRKLRLDAWSVAFVGADTIHAKTLERFADAFAVSGFRSKSFYPCYGLAEATLMVSGGERNAGVTVLEFDKRALSENRVAIGSAPAQSRAIVSCGVPAPHTELAVVEPGTGELCQADQSGEIWLRSPSVCGGYLADRDATDETFNGIDAAGRGPFLRTGDLGFLRDGELYITGRIKDLIIIQGRNVYPQDIERTIARDGLPVACVFSLLREGGEDIVAICELSAQAAASGGMDGMRAVAEQVVHEVADANEVRLDLLLIVKSGAVPRTTSGKLQRRLCRDFYLSGELHAIYAHGRASWAAQPGAVS